MKKRITVFLLLALLLTGRVFAAAGGADDPLISLSYLRGTFLPALRTSFAAISAQAAAAGRAEAAAPRTKTVTLGPGGVVELTSGQSLVLTAGDARITVTSGQTVNATKGWVTSGGDVRIGSRYIVCEDSTARVDVGSGATMTVSAAASVTSPCRFTDVVRGSWYYDDVLSAVARGLVDGMTPTTYEPAGTLTFAQCVKLAACMHQLSRDGAVTLAPGSPWFRPYADYALVSGILDADCEDYHAVIDRRSVVRIFYRALPAERYDAINDIADGAIPDVPSDAADAAAIYSFYRAGILSGYTNTDGYAEHAFGPDSSITRAEIAAIMNRMFDASARVVFAIDAEP